MNKIIFLILLFPLIVNAGDIEIHLQAYHHKLSTGEKDNALNNVTPGVGWSGNGYSFGVYHNSYNLTTAYLVKKIEMRYDFGYEIGVATGYKYPVVAGIYKEYGNFKIRLLPGSTIAIGLSFIF